MSAFAAWTMKGDPPFAILLAHVVKLHNQIFRWIWDFGFTPTVNVQRCFLWVLPTAHYLMPFYPHSHSFRLPPIVSALWAVRGETAKTACTTSFHFCVY